MLQLLSITKSAPLVAVRFRPSFLIRVKLLVSWFVLVGSLVHWEQTSYHSPFPQGGIGVHREQGAPLLVAINLESWYPFSNELCCLLIYFYYYSILSHFSYLHTGHDFYGEIMFLWLGPVCSELRVSDSLLVRCLDCFHSLHNIMLLETAVIHDGMSDDAKLDCYSFSDFSWSVCIWSAASFLEKTWGHCLHCYHGGCAWRAWTYKRSFHGSKLERRWLMAWCYAEDDWWLDAILVTNMTNVASRVHVGRLRWHHLD